MIDVLPPPQTVTYTADHENGYRADVQYSGVAAVLPARLVGGGGPVAPRPPPTGVALAVATTPLPFRAVPVSAVPPPVVRVSLRQATLCCSYTAVQISL